MSKVKDAIALAWRESPRGMLGIFADVVGVAAVAGSLTALLIAGNWATGILAASLAVICFLSLAISWRLEWELRRRDGAVLLRERVADSLPAIARACDFTARASLALTAGGSGASREFVLHCESACIHLARAFEAATGKECRVTMQETFVPDGGPLDLVAVKVIAASYQQPNPTGTLDLVTDNTDFSALMSGASHFLCNDLVAELTAGYKNSHWTAERLALWKVNGDYPYQATVVWPIRGLVTDSEADGGQRWDIRGFLSVDSTEAGTFDPDTIVAFGETITSSAYAGLVLYRTWDQEELWQD